MDMDVHSIRLAVREHEQLVTLVKR